MRRLRPSGRSFASACSAIGLFLAIFAGDPDVVAELPAVEAMMDRALELDAAFERGAIHTFLIGYESVRQGGAGDRKQLALSLRETGAAFAQHSLIFVWQSLDE